MMGRMIAGGSAADGAPQPTPQYNGNMGAPANYWQGNQMMIPGLAQGMQGMGGQPGQPGAPMMQDPQSALMALIEMLKQKH